MKAAYRSSVILGCLAHLSTQAPKKIFKNLAQKIFPIFLAIELSNYKIKKLLIFSQKSPPHFSVQAPKNLKKNSRHKKLLIFHEMELLTSNIEKIQEMITPKKIYISGNGNPRKLFLCFKKWKPQ